MTDDDTAAVQSATNAPTYGWGIPLGRTSCSGCGAEGVNIRTCPGDGSPHEATTEYVDRSSPGERPDHRGVGQGADVPGTPPRGAGYDPTLNEAAPVLQRVQAEPAIEAIREAVQEEEDHRAEFGSLVWDGIGRDPGRPQALQVTTVTVRLATTYPALAAARLEAFIEEALDECLWLGTDLQELS